MHVITNHNIICKGRFTFVHKEPIACQIKLPGYNLVNSLNYHYNEHTLYNECQLYLQAPIERDNH